MTTGIGFAILPSIDGGLALELSLGTTMLVEGFGTFMLVTIIFLLTEGCNVGRPSEGASPTVFALLLHR